MQHLTPEELVLEQEKKIARNLVDRFVTAAEIVSARAHALDMLDPRRNDVVKTELGRSERDRLVSQGKTLEEDLDRFVERLDVGDGPRSVRHPVMRDAHVVDAEMRTIGDLDAEMHSAERRAAAYVSEAGELTIRVQEFMKMAGTPFECFVGVLDRDASSAVDQLGRAVASARLDVDTLSNLATEARAMNVLFSAGLGMSFDPSATSAGRTLPGPTLGDDGGMSR